MTKIGENPPALPKRFYKTASLADGGAVFLDGKPAKTRAGIPLRAASRKLGAAIVDEWNAQGDMIDFASMPMTRFEMTVLDRGEEDAGLWRAAALAFLCADLVCYRAPEPAELVARQAAAWDPLVEWAASEGIALTCGSGIAYVEQPRASLGAAKTLVARASAREALALKMAAEIAGSSVIALALGRGAFEADELFEASRVDETFQAEKWGWDAEAEARARALKRDFLNAARYSLLAAGAG